MINVRTLYITTVLVWGTSWLAIKYQLGVVAPELSVAYRFGAAALIFLAYCLIKKKSLRFSKIDHVFLFSQGILLFCLNYILFYYATEYLTTGLISVIFSLIVILNPLLASLFLKTKISNSVLFGALLGMVGISFVFGKDFIGAEFSAETLKGVVLSLVATISASAGNIISARNQKNNIPVIQGTAISMCYGAAAMMVYALYLGRELTFDLSLSYVLSFVYLTIFATVIAFYSYLTVLGKIGVDKAAYATVLFPIIALMLSTVFEDYQWQIHSIFGVILILSGSIFVLRKKSPAKSCPAPC